MSKPARRQPDRHAATKATPRRADDSPESTSSMLPPLTPASQDPARHAGMRAGRKHRSATLRSGLIRLACAFVLLICGIPVAAVASPRPASSPSPEAAASPPAVSSPSDPATLEAQLARAFRIDIEDLQVDYDYWPQLALIEGAAVLRFRLRPGQQRALFHFNPLRTMSQDQERALLHTLVLDGDALDPLDDGDLRQIRPMPGAERAFEIQRELAPDEVHTLEVDWSMPNPDRQQYPGWFYPNFDDTEGPTDENEALWPTISSPEEFTRHRIRLRVHDAQPYTAIGSGVVARMRSTAGIQSWEIDSARPIASHTMFFAAVPSAQVRRVRFKVRDVDVTIVTDQPPRTADLAQRIIRGTIPRLVDDFGPFPTPNMQILLTGWSSGMEYYGATRTGIGALEHELAHMYFGAATVNRTWRDTWFDEAAVMWWLDQDQRQLPDDFTSDLARDRPAVAPGFNLDAYDDGPRILDEVAGALGGNPQMIAFLRDLHERRAFEPFTTDDLIDDIVAAQDWIDREQLERWLYDGR